MQYHNNRTIRVVNRNYSNSEAFKFVCLLCSINFCSLLIISMNNLCEQDHYLNLLRFLNIMIVISLYYYTQTSVNAIYYNNHTLAQDAQQSSP